MPNQDAQAGLSRASSKETNNYSQGRSGAKVEMKNGPAAGRSGSPNPTKSGGINRPTSRPAGAS